MSHVHRQVSSGDAFTAGGSKREKEELQAGQAAQEAKVDFVIGSIQDKPLFEGLGLAHINLGPFYFFNQFNFVPWPYAGVRGVLNLFSEMSRVAQDAFSERQAWGQRGYKPHVS